MKLDISRVDVWAASIEDRPGALAEKLDALSQQGTNLEFLIARRAPEKPGTGVVFVTPIKGASQVKAAKKAGFEKTKSLHAIRVAAIDKPGLGVRLHRQCCTLSASPSLPTTDSLGLGPTRGYWDRL